ncbi:MAG: hypothetical protein ACE14M_06490 [Terriglobales bacterium]
MADTLLSALIFVLGVIFSLGLAGSAIVIVVTFIEDVRVFKKESSPQYRDESVHSQQPV